MEFLSIKQKIIIGVICVVLITIIAIYIIQKSSNNYSYIELEEENINETENVIEYESKKISENTIILHIAGEVNEQGVIEIESGARVIDAIEEAGGLTEEADISDVNLAYELKDGQKIYIPKEGEESSYIIEGNNRRKRTSKYKYCFTNRT